MIQSIIDEVNWKKLYLKEHVIYDSINIQEENNLCKKKLA